MTTYRHKPRTSTPGAYRLKSGTLSQLVALADVRLGVGRGDGGIGTLAAGDYATGYSAGYADGYAAGLAAQLQGIVAAVQVQDIGAILRSALLADGSIYALVAQRIYADAREQGAAKPAIEYLVVSSVPHQHLAGLSGAETARIQYDCLSSTRLEADALARLCINLLAKIQQQQSGVVWVEGVAIQGGIRYDRGDPADGSDSPTYRASFDVSVTYQVST